jgi:hypothetical protein
MTLQRCNIPSLVLPKVTSPTPFVNLAEPGDKITFGDFNTTFKVDENFKAYLDIFNWMVQLGYPKSYDDYKSGMIINNERKNLLTDATLTLYTNSMNPNLSIEYKNIWPTFLTEVNLETVTQGIEYVEGQASFAYDYFDIKYLD